MDTQGRWGNITTSQGTFALLTTSETTLPRQRSSGSTAPVFPAVSASQRPGINIAPADDEWWCFASIVVCRVVQLSLNAILLRVNTHGKLAPVILDVLVEVIIRYQHVVNVLRR